MSRGGSLPCSFALELQQERVFGVVSAKSSAISFALYNSPFLVFTCPLLLTQLATSFAMRIEKKEKQTS